MVGLRTNLTILVKEGIDSISLNPDSVLKTLLEIWRISSDVQKKIYTDKHLSVK
jgi:hypothetical protein